MKVQLVLVLVGLAAVSATAACSADRAADADEGVNRACLEAVAEAAPLAPKDKLGQNAIARLQTSTSASGWTVMGRTAPRPGFPVRDFTCAVARTGGGVGEVTVTRDSGR